MNSFARSILLPLAFAAASSPALAASSAWFETEGGRVRLVTSGAADAEGHLRGILDISLLPGWKTYWRDPGGSGVPPIFDISRSLNLTAADLAFPAPQRHDEGDFVWSGYDHPVALPVTFKVAPGGGRVEIDADVFLGICQTICIPVKAEFVLDPTADPQNPDDQAAVDAAYAALPAPATDAFGAVLSDSTAEKLVVEAHAPVPANTEFFIAGTDDYSFGTPERVEKDGKLYFAMEMNAPETRPAKGGLHYTLVSGGKAVSGLLPYP